MSFREFNEDIKAKNLKSVCLLWGRERFLSEWAESEIIKNFSNELSRQFDVIEFDGGEADIYKIVEACETLPLFSDKKLVIVDGFPGLEGKSAGAGEDLLLDYVKSPSETTILVFICGEKIDKRRTIYKAVAKSGSIYEFVPLNRRELAAWVKKRFKLNKKIIDDRELAFLIDTSGYLEKDSEYSLYHFENDISKVLLHSEEEKISHEDITNTVSGNVNANVFTMIDYIGAGDKKKAFDMLNELFLYGQNEYGMLALLWRQYENVLNVKQLLGEGKSKGEVVALLKSRDFIVGKWMALGRRYSEERLKKILQTIYNGDKLIKSGDMDSRMVLELIVATI